MNREDEVRSKRSERKVGGKLGAVVVVGADDVEGERKMGESDVSRAIDPEGMTRAIARCQANASSLRPRIVASFHTELLSRRVEEWRLSW